MISDWLYPLSGKSKYGFIDSSGKKLSDTSFDSFKKMMQKPCTDNWWVCSTNFRQVSEGDRVWCYYGTADGDLGIVALATIHEIHHGEEKADHQINLRWNRRATGRLMATPVPATVVRKFIPWPAASVMGLDSHQKLVTQLKQASGLR